MTKWPIIAIVILLLFILSLIFIPKNIFNDILYKVEHLILGVQERKIEKKEGEGKAIEKNVKTLEDQDKSKAKNIVKLKKQREQIKPSESLQELKKESARLGYPTK